MLRRIDRDDWQNFLKLCLKAKDVKKLQQLLDLFLTPAEQKDFVDRYNIVAALLAGKITQREISKKLKISIAKVTRGSNVLKKTDKNLIKFLQQHLK